MFGEHNLQLNMGFRLPSQEMIFNPFLDSQKMPTPEKSLRSAGVSELTSGYFSQFKLTFKAIVKYLLNLIIENWVNYYITNRVLWSISNPIGPTKTLYKT